MRVPSLFLLAIWKVQCKEITFVVILVTMELLPICEGWTNFHLVYEIENKLNTSSYKEEMEIRIHAAMVIK